MDSYDKVSRLRFQNSLCIREWLLSAGSSRYRSRGTMKYQATYGKAKMD